MTCMLQSRPDRAAFVFRGLRVRWPLACGYGESRPDRAAFVFRGLRVRWTLARGYGESRPDRAVGCFERCFIT